MAGVDAVYEAAFQRAGIVEPSDDEVSHLNRKLDDALYQLRQLEIG